MKVFDSSFLSLALRSDARAPNDPSTGKPVERAQQRIEYLIETLTNQGQKIIIPTPALSEFLVLAGDDGPMYLDRIGNSSVMRIKDFDERAAVEAAFLHIKAKNEGDKKSGSESTWAKIKFDRQIVAIAKVNGADKIYSTDRDVFNFGKDAGIAVENVYDLPEVPPEQIKITFEGEQENEECQAQPQEPEPQAAGVQRSGDGSADGPAAAQEPQATGSKPNGEAKGKGKSEGQKVVEAGAVKQKTKPDTSDDAKADPQG